MSKTFASIRLLIEDIDTGVLSGYAWLPVPEGWEQFSIDGDCLVFFMLPNAAKVAVSHFRWHGQVWIHASISRTNRMPDYEDLTALKRDVFGDSTFAAQVFPPSNLHVNVHETCLHLWGPVDSKDWPMPIFGKEGSI